MKNSYRTTAWIVGLGLVATAATLRRAPDRGLDPAITDDVSSFAHTQEESHAPEGSGAPQDHGQGETAAESAVYADEQGQATRPPQWSAIDDHNNATRGPLQPIPFNHRFHSGPADDGNLQLDCMYCHAGTEKSVSGVVPSLDVCMGCHQIAGTGLPPIEELRGYWARGEAVPWMWVYKLPEFVQFSHQPHIRSGVECQSCHGPVEEMDRVYQWAPLTMGWCLECHRGAPQETDVATDHVLAGMNPPPQPPDARQPGSFYPRAIDSQYGAQRAPTDCAACHY